MEQLFRVAIDFEEHNGHVDYNLTNRSVQVVLTNEQKRQEVEAYLQQEHTIRVPQPGSLLEFSEVTVHPTDSLDTFKLALTRMWSGLGVAVQWSRPV